MQEKGPTFLDVSSVAFGNVVDEWEQCENIRGPKDEIKN